MSSYEGGCGEVNDHCRTVLSLDAERMVCLEGKATARTYADRLAVRPIREKLGYEYREVRKSHDKILTSSSWPRNVAESLNSLAMAKAVSDGVSVERCCRSWFQNDAGGVLSWVLKASK